MKKSITSAPGLSIIQNEEIVLNYGKDSAMHVSSLSMDMERFNRNTKVMTATILAKHLASI